MFRRTIRFLWPYFAPFKWRLALGYLFIIGSVVTLGAIPDVMRRGLRPFQGVLPPLSELKRMLLADGAWILGLAVVSAACTFAMRVLIIGISRRIERILRMDFFAHLSSLDFLTLNRLQTGDLISRATGDLEGVRMLLGPAVMHFSRTALLTPVALFFMLRISWILTVVALLPMVLVAITVKLLGPVMHRRARAAQDRLGELSAHAQESFAGIEVVQAFAREEHEGAVFSCHAKRYRDAQISVSLARGIFIGIITSLSSLGVVAFVLFTPGQVSAGVIASQDAIAFLAYIEMLVWPMIAFGWTTTLFQRGAASVDRLQVIFSLEPQVAEPQEPRPLDVVEGEYRLEGVYFSYHAEVPVLRGIDLTIPKGATVAIMGPIGSGKTTLVRLLLRLFDPQRGRVLLDGRDLRELPLSQVRGSVGYAPQDGFLFSNTIAGNVSYAMAEDESVSPEQLAWAVETSQLVADLDQFPHGYETIVGERGVSLSGGQRQRAALARALLPDPPVLILDDTLSAVDTSTEEEILARLRDVMADRTTIIVAHRVSTVRYADRIVVLEDGQVTAEGTDADLMARPDGYYARIAKRQRLTAEIEAL